MSVAQKKSPVAFTLVEIMVTVAILLIGIVAALSAVTYGLRGGNDATNRVMATALASEGLELVRNIRDNNWINSRAFDTQLADGTYIIYYASPGLATSVQAAGVNPPPLDFDSSSGLYGYNSAHWAGSTFPAGTPSRFTRTITILHQIDSVANTASKPKYLHVTATVTWQDHGTKQIKLDTHLYDWRL